MRRPIRQKRSVVEYLTTLSSALDRRGCHTPYICPDAVRFEAWFEFASAIPTSPPFCVVPLFRRLVFCSLQEQPRYPLVSATSAIEHIGARAMERAALLCSQNKRIRAMGLF